MRGAARPVRTAPTIGDVPSRWRRIAWPLVGVLALAACAGSEEHGPRAEGATTPAGAPATSPAAPQPPDDPAAPIPPPLTWEPCGSGLECATLAVPLDHDDPQGRRIDLAVARRPVADPDDRIGTLFVNPGGPGASGIDHLRHGGPGGRLADRFDVVAWDPRGTGGSTRLDCDEGTVAFRALDPSPDDAAEQRALDDAAAALAAACTSADPGLVANLDATVVARDLDLLRRALGEERVSFAGYSYGTLLALEYARAFPERVRALVLDGVVDPGQAPAELLEDQAVAIERVLRTRLADCDGCALEDPVAVFDAVAARVERDPLPSSAGPPVGPARLALAGIAATYRSDGPTVLAEALADAEDGDGTALDRLAAGYDGAVTAFMAYVATVCADGPHPTGASEAAAFADRLAGISPWFGEAIANEVLPCAFWTVPPGRVPTPIAPGDRAGTVPMLVIGTTDDVATPYATAERLAAALPGAVLLTHAGAGHTASGRDPCVDGAVRRFLVELVPPEPGTTCPG